MKIKNLIAVLFIVLFAGCSKKADVTPSEVTAPKLLPADKTVYSSEYAENLNVIYFIANDKVANERYEERLSEIFMETQAFFNKWMIYWGYGNVTFGLLKDETKSKVKIHTVYGSKPLQAYSNNMQAIVDEVEQHFESNPRAKTSRHTMVMIAFNEKNKIGSPIGFHVPHRAMPHYGFAIEHPELKKEHVQTEYVYLGLPPREQTAHQKAVRHGRGMIYELAHVMELLPHRRSMSHPLNEDEEGQFPLMGMEGSKSWWWNASDPTFLTYFDATILANSPLFSKKAKTVNKKATAEITIINNTWDREKHEFELSGVFQSSTPVSHISFRLRSKTDIIGNNSEVWTLLPLEGNRFVFSVSPWTLLKYKEGNDPNAKLEIIFHHTTGGFTSKSYAITNENIFGDDKFEAS